MKHCGLQYWVKIPIFLPDSECSSENKHVDDQETLSASVVRLNVHIHIPAQESTPIVKERKGDEHFEHMSTFTAFHWPSGHQELSEVKVIT